MIRWKRGLTAMIATRDVTIRKISQKKGKNEKGRNSDFYRESVDIVVVSDSYEFVSVLMALVLNT